MLNLSIKELQLSEIDFLVDYWMNSDPQNLINMGVDLDKMPTKVQFTNRLKEQIQLPIEQKQSYGLIWLLNNEPIGHCNTNPTEFENEAFMHLHLWHNSHRQKGLGCEFVKKSLPFFFENLKLKKLISQPYALNMAPNKTLEKVGFTFIKEYTTIPGSINFEQPVKRWELTNLQYHKIST